MTIAQKMKEPLTLALDLDGTCDEAPSFFRTLSQLWPGKIYIVTFRLDQSHAEQYAKKLGVRFDELILAKSHADKGRILAEIGAKVFIEDTDEAIQSVSSDVFVLKVRHLNNFDFEAKQWI